MKRPELEEIAEFQIIEEIERAKKWKGRRINLESLKDFYPTDLIYFLKETNNIELRKYQLLLASKIIRSSFHQKGRRIFSLWARGSGKTETIVDSAYFMAITFPSIYQLPFTKGGFDIGIFAPIQKQSSLNIYARLRERINQFLNLDVLDTEADLDNIERMKLSNGTTIFALTASKEANIEGHHFHLIIVDESQDIPDIRLKKSIYGMGAAKNATRVLIGSATPEHRNFFYDQLMRARPFEKSVLNAHEAMEQMNLKDRKNYETYIAKMKTEIGRDSIEFRTQFLCEWISGKDIFIDLNSLSSKAHSSRSHEMKTKECFGGIDVGKINDPTVVTIVDKEGRVLNWLELQNIDYPAQAERIKNFLSNYNIVQLAVDSAGAGAGLADLLSPSFTTLQIFTTPQIKDELYRKVRLKLNSENFSYPSEECFEKYKFERQFSDLVCRYKGNYLTPEKPRKYASHDDYCDSYAFALKASEMGDTSLIGEFEVGKKK